MPDHTPLKHCSQCGNSYPATFEYFHRDKRASGGLRAECKVCACEKKRKYHADNRERNNARSRAYGAKNRDARIAYNRQYYAENQATLLKQKREYHAANREEINAKRRKYQSENRHIFREYERNFRARNPDYARAKSNRWYVQNWQKARAYQRKYAAEYRVIHLARVRGTDKIVAQRRRARKRRLPDNFTPADWQHALDYFKGCCAACRRPPGLFHTLAMDHWIPLTAADCPGTIPSNIVPLCHGIEGCNNSKSNRNALEWAIEKFGKRKGTEIASRILAYFSATSTR